MLHSISPGTSYSYKAHESDTLLSEVASVQLILLPRALAAAGFSADGKVLMVHYTESKPDHSDWGCDFFEHQFINEPLLGVPQQVKALFVGSPSQLIIPAALYDERVTRGWLRQLYPILGSDWITEYRGEADKVIYRMAIPQPLHKLLARYFGHTSVLPLAAAQLYKPNASATAQIQCTITGEHVFATLRKEGKLRWHRIFEYENVHDIAWQFATLCRHEGIPLIDLRLDVSLLCESCYDTLLELETYFPKTKWATHAMPSQGHWAPVIYAMQQLYACAL